MVSLRFTSLACLGLAACTGTSTFDVQIVDPCNQDALAASQLLELEPRGDGINSAAFTTVVSASSGSAPVMELPPATNFQIVATGYGDASLSPPVARGISSEVDLSAGGQQSLRMPFALVNHFYRTTRLSTGECTSLNVGRHGATATLLPDSGRVLIVGGANLGMESGVPVLSYTRLIELYDPATGELTPAAELRSGGARAFHTATLLADGRVLIAGGEAYVSLTRVSLKSALLIDPRDPGNVRVSEAIDMRAARTGHIATRLADGRVLIAGGRVLSESSPRPEDHTYLRSVEIFDPSTGAFITPVDTGNAPIELAGDRFGHSGFTLRSGVDVVVAGGMNASGPVPTLEVLHFDGDRLTVTISPVELLVGPIFHAGDLTPSGELLLAGGYFTAADADPFDGSPSLNSTANVEKYGFDPLTREMQRLCTDALYHNRARHTISVSGESAIIIGGTGSDGLPIATAEIAPLVSGGANCFARAPDPVEMADPRTEHSVARMEHSGELLVVGGRQQDVAEPYGRSTPSTEVFVLPVDL